MVPARAADAWPMGPRARAIAGTGALAAFAPIALALGGTDGIGGLLLLAAGGFGIGYWVGSTWALLAAAPFLLVALVALGSPGPLENTDTTAGELLLVVVVAPVTAALAVGAWVGEARR